MSESVYARECARARQSQEKKKKRRKRSRRSERLAREESRVRDVNIYYDVAKLDYESRTKEQRSIAHEIALLLRGKVKKK